MDDLSRLEKLQADLEKVVLMPLKPYQAPPIAPLAPKATSTPIPPATVTRPGSAAETIVRENSRRHDSGSDSGNELALDDVKGAASAAGNAGVADENIPQDIFELIKKICSVIVMTDNSVGKTKVVKGTLGLIEHCEKKEAFTMQQKQRLRGWYQTLRNPSSFRGGIRQQPQYVEQLSKMRKSFE